MSAIRKVSGAYLAGDRQVLSAEEARRIIAEVKGNLENLQTLLLELYAGRAWTALGYESWRKMVSAEFELSTTRAYEILDWGRVDTELSFSAMAEKPANERQARPLVALIDQPDVLGATWGAITRADREHPARIVQKAVDAVRAVPDHERTPEKAAEAVWQSLRPIAALRSKKNAGPTAAERHQRHEVERVLGALRALSEVAQPETVRAAMTGTQQLEASGFVAAARDWLEAFALAVKAHPAPLPDGWAEVDL